MSSRQMDMGRSQWALMFATAHWGFYKEEHVGQVSKTIRAAEPEKFDDIMGLQEWRELTDTEIGTLGAGMHKRIVAQSLQNPSRSTSKMCRLCSCHGLTWKAARHPAPRPPVSASAQFASAFECEVWTMIALRAMRFGCLLWSLLMLILVLIVYR